MSIENYNLLQKQENENQIAIDFDDVVHLNSKGFHDGTVYDSPVPGVQQAFKQIKAAGYDIVIFTAKAKPDRPLVHGKTGAMLIWEWLEAHSLSSYIKQVTSEKPRAKYYIDDKAIRFTDWDATLKQIL